MIRLIAPMLLCGLLAMAAQAQEEAEAPADGAREKFVVICEILGEIDPGVAVVVERAVREAEGAELLVFSVNTPGGRVDSAIEITIAILGAKCPTVAFVNGMGAISAGAIISYSCDDIVMGPATGFGASTPFVPGVELSEDVEEKSYSFVRNKFRALGEEKGHNVLLGEAMVDREIELYGRRDAEGNYVVYRVRRNRVIDTSSNQSSEDAEAADDVDNIIESLREGGEIPFDEIEKTLRETIEKASEKKESNDGVLGEIVAAKTEEGSSDALPEDAELICDSGELLTLSSKEALRYGLAVHEAVDLEEVLEIYGQENAVRVDIKPNWAEALYAWLTTPMISGLLLMCAMGGIYLEVRTPGFGFPGAVGITCLAVFLGTQVIVGLADWGDILLIGIGLGLIIIEVFILPGFGLVGAVGALCLLVGFYLALVRVPIPEYAWDFKNLEDVGLTLTIAMGLFLLFTIATWKLLPQSSLFRFLKLAEAQDADAGYVVQTQADTQSAIGLCGTATSVLRPAGKGRFAGRTYDVVTRGEFIEKGAAIEIIKAEGNRYVVAAPRPKPGEPTG